MNLNFLGLKMKMVLPLFLLIGLFMLSASSASAQYITKREAKRALESHLSQLPKEVHTFAKVNQALTPKMVDEKVNELRHMFGRSVMFKLASRDVKEALSITYDIAKSRIPADMPELVAHLDAVRDEYENLLKK